MGNLIFSVKCTDEFSVKCTENIKFNSGWIKNV